MNASSLRRFSFFFVLLCVAMMLRTELCQAEIEPVPAILAITTANDSGKDDSQEPADAPQGDDWSAHLRAHRHHHRDHDERDIVNVGHDSYLPADQKAGSVVSIFGSAISEGEADAVVSVVGKSQVTGPVAESVVAVLGRVYVDSKVDGDVVGVLGGVTLGPHAEVGGDVVTVLGSQSIDPHAIVHGGNEHILGADLGDTGWLQTWIKECALKGRLLALAPGLGWAWSLALTALAFYTLLALLFKPGVTRCVQTLESQPGHTLLAALVAVLLTPVLIVLLLVTVIGIAAIPFVVMALFCMSLFGKAVILAWLGQRVLGNRTGAAALHPAVAVLIGGVIAMALYLVPVLGFLLYKLLGFFGFGAVVYTLLLDQRARQSARADRYHATAPPGNQASGASTAASMAGARAQVAAAAPAEESRDAPLSGGATSEAAAGAGAAPGPVPPVLVALPRAGFWLRMGALALDVILIGILMSVSNSFFWGWRHETGQVHLFALAVYGACMWKLRGSTLGGSVCDLRVVRLDGRPMEWETAIVRALGCFLSLAVCGLGFIWIAFDPARQAWHDKIAGTVVVRVPKGTS